MSDTLDIVLLKPFNGGNFGDVISVNQGLYETMINLEMGISTLHFEEELSVKQNLILQCKELEKENKDFMEYNHEATCKIFNLERKVKEQQKELKKYENKMMEINETK